MVDIQDLIQGERLLHSLGVVENIEIIIRDEEESIKGVLREAARFHDVGYSKKLKRSKSHHALDGYLFIKDQVSPLASYLVLTHTGAEDLIPRERKKEYLDEKKNALERVMNEGYSEKELERYLMLLNWADIHTSPTGDFIASKDRLLDVVKRYGEASYVAQSLAKEIEKLYNL